jgi:hypothetical protein
MFGVERFDFDSGLNLRFCQDDEPENLPARSQEVHERLFDKSLAFKTAAGRIYDRAVRETQCEVGETVFAFSSARSHREWALAGAALAWTVCCAQEAVRHFLSADGS